MKKALLITALCLVTLMSEAQTVVVINFMKVPQSGGTVFMANEKEWKKLHQMHVDAGKLIAWELFYIHNHGTKSDYNFATIDIYENLQASLQDFSMDDAKKVWGDKVADVLKKTSAARDLVYSEVVAWEMGIPNKDKEKYIMVNYMKTDDFGKYLEMEKKAYQPMHQVAVDQGKMNGWSVWSRWFASDTSYDAVTVNSFSSSQQLAGLSYEAMLEQVKGGKNANDLYEMVNLMEKTSKIRTIVKTELWELLDSTVPKKAAAGASN